MSSTCQKLSGKVAIITGSSDGIGAAIALEFAKEGALLTLTGRSEEKLKKVSAACMAAMKQDKQKGSHGGCKSHKSQPKVPLTIAGDINDEKVRQKLIEETLKYFNKIDILINNAGRSNVVPIEQNLGLTPLDEMLDIHIRAPYDLTKRAMDQLIKNKGIIINISSVIGKRGGAMVTLEYSMAKNAMDQFTYWLARELGPKGVRANSINPGGVMTNIMAEHKFSPDRAEKMLKYLSSVHALQRIGKPEEIAHAAVFLASENSSFVTGTNLIVDGGFSVMPVAPLMAINIE